MSDYDRFRIVVAELTKLKKKIPPQEVAEEYFEKAQKMSSTLMNFPYLMLAIYGLVLMTASTNMLPAAGIRVAVFLTIALYIVSLIVTIIQYILMVKSNTMTKLENFTRILIQLFHFLYLYYIITHYGIVKISDLNDFSAAIGMLLTAAGYLLLIDIVCLPLSHRRDLYWLIGRWPLLVLSYLMYRFVIAASSLSQYSKNVTTLPT
jgi:hypothetical protein